MTGPRAKPPAAAAVQMPMASARSRSSAKTVRRIASVEGMIIAPPMPSSARAAMSCSGDSETAPNTDAPAKRTNPMHNSRRRPTRSPRVPIATSSPARTSEYGVDDPQQLGRARVEVGGKRRQGDVEDGVVHREQQQAHGEHGEDGPAVASRRTSAPVSILSTT
jgi:hypothetical protein